MEKIEITNPAGNRRVFTLDYQYGKGEEALEDVRGFTQDFSVNLTYERSPYQQGATTVAIRTGVRPLSFVLNIMRRTKKEVDLRVQDIVRFLNPYEGPLYIVYDNGNRRRRIKAYYNAHTVVDENLASGYASLAIDLVGDDALFEDENERTFTMGDEAGLFTVPLTIDSVDGFQLGEAQLEEVLENTGDYHYPVEIYFQGEVSNPVIVRRYYRNGSDEVLDEAKLELANFVIPVDSHVRINTKRGEEEVTLVNPDGTEENINRYLTTESTFFQILVGKNIISFETTTGNPSTEIKYRQKYITA